ncbi:hypothetical protein F5B18DRAFT_596291 [Nemania serpens]|nr:hypothetical protein F5B18DRAFT_596291 [Nemania serpens]
MLSPGTKIQCRFATILSLSLSTAPIPTLYKYHTMTSVVIESPRSLRWHLLFLTYSDMAIPLLSFSLFISL